MEPSQLQQATENIVRRAQRQGFVQATEVREECRQAGLAEERWQEVITRAGTALLHRNERYYFVHPVTDRVRAEQAQQNDIHQAIQMLARWHRESPERLDRRAQDRIEFIVPVRVILEDGRQVTLLTRDLSPTGIRLIGGRRLLGQKIHVLVPSGQPDGGTWDFQVRILWTCPLGDDLVENGGDFLTVTPPGSASDQGSGDKVP
jgi:hypothetical protein